jgi:hypothetical protein
MSLYLIKPHAMKVELHAFLTLILEGGELWVSHLVRLGNEPQRVECLEGSRDDLDAVEKRNISCT